MEFVTLLSQTCSVFLFIGKNCLSEKEQEHLLHLLRTIAYSTTHKGYKMHFDSLLKSET